MENEPSFLLESAEGQQAETNQVGFSSDVEDLFKGKLITYFHSAFII